MFVLLVTVDRCTHACLVFAGGCAVLYPVWPPVLREKVPYLLYALIGLLVAIEIGAW